MNAVYDCITEGKVGIFESPTGTGKSLSLICSTLTWLRDEQRKNFSHQVDVKADDDEPAWIVEQARQQRTEVLLQQRLELESRLSKIREKELLQKRQFEKGEPARKRRKGSEAFPLDYSDEQQYVLDDYESDGGAQKSEVAKNCDGGFSAATLQLIHKLGGPSQLIEKDSESELTDELKVFFCSRTHSQLTQFVNELRRVQLPSAPWMENRKDSVLGGTGQQNIIKHLSLGSRRNLCINDKVANAGSTTTINERCLDLQQPSTNQEKRCGFLPNTENEALVNEFRDHTLAKIQDIEELGVQGKRIGICPYYATRASIKPSEVISPMIIKRNWTLTLCIAHHSTISAASA